jgi:hypothetical protein
MLSSLCLNPILAAHIISNELPAEAEIRRLKISDKILLLNPTSLGYTAVADCMDCTSWD